MVPQSSSSNNNNNPRWALATDSAPRPTLVRSMPVYAH